MNKSNVDELLALADKHFKMFMIMNRWTRLLQDKKSVVDYFDRKKYKEIAIYGFNYIGETLVRELNHSDISIRYIVDRNADYMYAPTKIVLPTDEFESVDVMIVTVLDDGEHLIKDLECKCDFDVISIENVLKEA